MKKLSAKELERYLGFEPGAFDHIPHYAREDAIYAIRNVRYLEKRKLFRPGLYYIVLSDLCRSTEASLRLGPDLNKKRVESFILKCIETLGYMNLKNYTLFLREIGDAVLILFSSFADVYEWWRSMESWLDTQNSLWSWELSEADYKVFRMEAKTVVHAGEVAYSGTSIPIAPAVNQVFKVEKIFGPRELGITGPVRTAAAPIIKSLGLRPRKKSTVKLPGSNEPIVVYLAEKIRRRTKAR
jgi:class 3 adenylate cyclase